VTKDYAGFDEASNVDREGVFRLNFPVGRQRFAELIGYRPAQHAQHEADFDYTAIDKMIPHPVYATQGWVSVLDPGEQTDDHGRTLITEDHARGRPAPTSCASDWWTPVTERRWIGVARLVSAC
jgi:hypothetical protein